MTTVLVQFVVLSGMLLAIARIDAVTLRIPDVLSLPLIAIGLAVSGLAADAIVGAVAGFAVLAAVGEVFFRRTGQEGLGLGDAKLFAAAGAWLGWRDLPTVLLVAAAGGLIWALARRLRRKPQERGIAFGPWLALGFWLVWVWKHVQAGAF